MFGSKKIRVLAGDLSNEQIKMLHIKFYRSMKDVNSVIFINSFGKQKVYKIIYWQDIKSKKYADDMLAMGML